MDLLAASLLLHQGKLSDEGWLAIFSRAVGSASVACVRWTRDKPENAVVSSHGDYRELPTGWKTWVNHAISKSTRREPGFIEDFIQTTPEPALFKTKTIDDPQILLGIVDWTPACIVMVMVRGQNAPDWTPFERKYINRVLHHVRESISVHKELDRRRYIGGLANEILNSSPRGMVALSDDGSIQMANTRAEKIFEQNDGISRHQGKLLIQDKQVAKILADYLGNLTTVTSESLPEMDWNMSVKRPSGAAGYQIIIGSLKLQQWNIESRSSDRIGIVYLHDPTDTSTRPSIEQMKSFYGLTTAQAKLAGALYTGKGINEAAKALNISVNTARSHMRNIYLKTGVRTQAELLGLLTSGLKTYGERKN